MLSAEILLSPEGPYKTLTDLWDDPEEELRIEKYLKSLYVFDAPCLRTELSSGATDSAFACSKSEIRSLYAPGGIGDMAF